MAVRFRSPIGPALLLLALVAACSPRQLGLPRVELSAKSPDGRLVAFVRSHPEVDPPNHSLWLERVGESPVSGECSPLRTLVLATPGGTA